MRHAISLVILLAASASLWGARAMAFDQSEAQALLAAKGPDYKPRTEHFEPDGSPSFTNRLIRETSPYLAQHAHNPVDWYPWGAEAFAAAKAQDKPVFLSIGYATCHWCHVMERESFEDIEIAERLNRDFISIKVDREERPDVDQVYMTAVQLMEQRGGWPMTAFLTHDATPFFGGTYFPPSSFTDLLGQVGGAWKSQRLDLILYGDDVKRAIDGYLNSAQEAGELSPSILQLVARYVLTRSDDLLGGTQGAPKFPQEPLWRLAASALPWVAGENQAALAQQLVLTLDEMQRGGIRDHLGGGFHRYSTDPEWLAPHFEKMLYNQSQLAGLFLDGYWLTGRADFLATAQDTLDYVARDMRSADGLFYSATDADSLTEEGELEEGAFFVWRADELDALLSAGDAVRVADLYGVRRNGNWGGVNILHLPEALDPEDQQFLDSKRQVLLDHRATRAAPLLDNKSITSWNSWMITSFAQAAQTVPDADDRARYADVATKAVNALRGLHWNRETGRLIRISIDGKVGGVSGQVDDYAGFISALSAVYDLTRDAELLADAAKAAEVMVAQFTEAGAVYMVAASGNDLVIRPTETYDGATPSGRSLAFTALVDLYERTGALGWQQAANQLLGAMAGNLNDNPLASGLAVQTAVRFQRSDQRAQPVAQLLFGKVQALFEPTAAGADLVLSVAPGWHINSNVPHNSDYVATQVSGDITTAYYPAGEDRSFDFSDELLSVYEGESRVALALVEEAKTVTLDIQACNDEICLPPEQVTFALPFSLAATLNQGER